MTKKLLIKNGIVITPSTTSGSSKKKLDVRIDGKYIIECGADLQSHENENVLDATNLWLLPGLIDLHTHLRDLGQSDREDIESGTKAAAFGGYTTVVAMANTEPPTDNKFVLGQIMQSIKQKACIRVLPVACVTKGMAGQELTDMTELSQMGAIAFSDDGLPLSNLAVLRQALQYSKHTQSLIISHPEDRDLSANGVMNESVTSVQLGLPGIPCASEAACIAREIEVVRDVGGRLHFAHVSTTASVKLIAQAKADGLSITADVTPHHLTLLDKDIQNYDTSYKMNPPLRSSADKAALVSALKEGIFDAIATDHAPHTEQDKQKPFDQAPFGIIGLETAFPLLLEALSEELSLSELVSFFTRKPAHVLGLEEPLINKDHIADLFVFDPALKWIYEPQNGFSKSKNTPFNSRTFTGKNLLTIYHGDIAYNDSTQIEKRMKREPSIVR